MSTQYVIAQNSVFVRAENNFVSVCIPVMCLKDAPAPIRGLRPLSGRVRLKIHRIPLTLLKTVIANAQVSAENGRLDETLDYVVWSNGRYHLIKPADLTLREEQPLMVNTMMAAIAANYCCQWVIRGEMTSLATAVTLEPPAMASHWITAEALHRAFGQPKERNP